ncbi:3-oxoacyl-[acyl-carrier-protein] synthase 3 [Salinivirga cyanobacteriivorans]|uniref:3-oxoacyl-[acyl-carrier-protein] synthase 3 n=1 Tax=Salinivirga cyanobacteriivorans TaxID=1307839 RepID=A0A0S2I375_9BACT|nr:SDR family NAD(P)-dependent oxidoreductase [Salinivirga cyanobacteriivorans]ALO16867.1 3-oxoacyl-[acyl-carrier-protein] synthase 3 [Salinivirga cyanobacteriivorans]
MTDNYVFTGIGYAHGKYKVTNDEIERAIKAGWIGDFNPDRILQLPEYKEFVKQNGETSPLEYFAWQKMGFHNRYHVVPFPPVEEAFKRAETTLELGVRAVDDALKKSGVHPEHVDLWLAGTATPFEQAPGIGATIKAHFTHWDNACPAATVNSACVGFNINIERALDYFKMHPEAQNIVIVHTEVMSGLLMHEPSFVPYVTFADAAAAVVLTRTQGEEKEGITFVRNGEDLHMIDFLGANRQGDLYMGPTRVKERATKNIINISQQLLKDNQWNVDSMDMLIPHQTGHAIVQSAASALKVPEKKLYQEVQLEYGNLSGASVPFALGLLTDEKRLKPGMKLVTSVCGLGGEFGGFSYIVPRPRKKPQKYRPLIGKLALVTGATGGLGEQVTKQLASEGCNLILQYNSNLNKAEELSKWLDKQDVDYRIVRCNFADQKEVETFATQIKNEYETINYLVHTSAITGSLSRATDVTAEEMAKGLQVNMLSIRTITDTLASNVTDTVLVVGSVAEDALFSGSSTYVASKRALHSYTAGMARPFHKKGVKTIYYMLGLLNSGMVDKLNPKQQLAAMMSINQPRLLPAGEVADRVVRSLYRPKVANVQHSWEGDLIVRRDGYYWTKK